MGKLRTSSIFYRRGVPNTANSFGYLAQGNYQIVQPQTTSYYGFLQNINYNYNNVYNKNKS
jgi:hypothetical protein